MLLDPLQIAVLQIIVYVLYIYIYTKEPCLATKGTPIIWVTLDKEKKYIYERRKKEEKKQK